MSQCKNNSSQCKKNSCFCFFLIVEINICVIWPGLQNTSYNSQCIWLLPLYHGQRKTKPDTKNGSIETCNFLSRENEMALIFWSKLCYCNNSFHTSDISAMKRCSGEQWKHSRAGWCWMLVRAKCGRGCDSPGPWQSPSAGSGQLVRCQAGQ